MCLGAGRALGGALASGLGFVVVLVLSAGWWVWNAWWWGLAGARCWVLKGRLLASSAGQWIWLAVAGCGFWGRPFFENCTVDASIFVVCNKLLRAIGGCLGIKSR